MMKLQKPPLIRETSVNMSAWTRIKDVIYSKKSGNIYNDVILENELQSKLNVIDSIWQDFRKKIKDKDVIDDLGL